MTLATPTALTAIAVLALLAGCGNRGPEPWQAYVEGEFVYVASSLRHFIRALTGARLSAD
ncbi:lipoprotein [Pandoraea oxalativorans]|uniref:lipoprotein n=1 Tax=Pandoraea oxalativorans TaxID=573737 RepID=UPI001FDEFE79|nr:lipoprotein [Pandoraea oxalativorans]